jgi:hypothetical protein
LPLAEEKAETEKADTSNGTKTAEPRASFRPALDQLIGLGNQILLEQPRELGRQFVKLSGRIDGDQL